MPEPTEAARWKDEATSDDPWVQANYTALQEALRQERAEVERLRERIHPITEDRDTWYVQAMSHCRRADDLVAEVERLRKIEAEARKIAFVFADGPIETIARRGDFRDLKDALDAP